MGTHEEHTTLPEQLAEMSFRWPFRTYQAQALDAYESRGPDHLHRCYLVMPPGSGKTALGLEIIRREGNPAVVFCPNTAVQGQWQKQWGDFQPMRVPSTTSANDDAPIAFLTYQALCNLNPEHEELDEVALDLWADSIRRSTGVSGADARAEIDRMAATGSQQFRRDVSRFRRQARRMIARGDDHEQLLSLLHPNGQALVQRIREFDACTIVLDECHHLLEMWGYLIQAVVEFVGSNVTVVGLTATPPRAMTTREDQLYRTLFGYADFEVPTPAVVKEGDLAPYQELGFLTEPLPRESDYIAEQHIRFEELITELLSHDFATRPFLDWIQSRAERRFAPNGAQASWAKFERDNPDLAQATLRLFYRFDYLPPAETRFREPHRQPLSADDWIKLIEDFCIGYLRFQDDPRDQQAWEAIRAALPSLGYVLTTRGIRAHVSPIDRVLALSASKNIAAATILGVEAGELGNDLRALVLCDYERTGRELVTELRGVLDPQAGSAILLLEMLLNDPDVARLRPILLTGQTVACTASTASLLTSWITTNSDLGRDLRQTPFTPSSEHDAPKVVRIEGGRDWTPRNYVPLITRFFEDGGSQCLIGTRGLLGEGWNANRVNVLVDLTTASTATSVHQMRGRSIRLDPALPRKVANNWDIVCIDPEHPKGAADYERFVRKHRHYFAPNREGEIESGITHVHHELSPFGPPEQDRITKLNADLLRRATERDGAWKRWGIGEPYENRETRTVRIRAERALGVPSRDPIRGADAQRERGTSIQRGIATMIGSGALASGMLFAGMDPLLFALPLATLAGGTAWSLGPIQSALNRIGPSDHLEDFASAILFGLKAIGELPEQLTTDDLRIVIQDDGFYRCYLAGVSDEESARFSVALDELLAPLSAPRYIIPRSIADPPESLLDTVRITYNAFIRKRSGTRVVYHAVPEILARNRARVDAFQAAWNQYVSPGEALFHRNDVAQAIIAHQAGEDPFAITTQMRTLWR